MSDKITLLKTEIAARGIHLPEISKQFTQNDYINKAANSMNMSNHELANYLWNTYHTLKYLDSILRYWCRYSYTIIII